MRKALRRWATWQGSSTHPLRLALELLVTGWAVWPLLVLSYVFAMRLRYPIDLEWMEGGSLYQAYRFLHGLPIYVRDTESFAPYPYPPVHTLLLALVGIIDLDFWSGRLVSICFFALLCWVLCAEVVRQHQGASFGWVAGLLGVSVIACGYPELGQWYDLIRVDVTMMGLLVWGAARALAAKGGPKKLLVTATILSLAIFSKQTATVFVGWICLFSITRNPQHGLRLTVLIGALSASAFLGLNWITAGGFEHLVISNPGQHEVRGPVIAEGLQFIFRYVPFIAAVPFVMLLFTVRGHLAPRTIFWLGCLFLAIPASVVPYAKVGAYLNALLPAIVFVGPATVLLLGDIARQPGIVGLAARWTTLLGFSAFIGVHSLTPAQYVPSQERWRAARELNAIVSSLPGGLVVPYLGYLPARNGHNNPHWQLMAVWDAIWRNEPIDEIGYLKATGARWVLLHSRDVGAFANYVRQTSKLARRIPDSARVRMVTGAAVEIDELWERNGFAVAN